MTGRWRIWGSWTGRVVRLLSRGRPTDVPVPRALRMLGCGAAVVRWYVSGARLVSTRQAAAVAEAVGHTVAARGMCCASRGMCCVYGDTGLGKTVAVEQATATHTRSSLLPRSGACRD
ncbi:hypothetical protein GCM10018980_71020 [Streptomyces capoamus]|uniref:Uncharacterized protein n=1 Tax=Streptomyces capoamus TaxID=68183 RepID=A0A919F3E0_9ACTN|nr:hypothetical protein GCM10010501_17080 [Streptomyces libani subsp. rufus]GHG74195.1 hypothetical protein GCM10018980_71020 [Streptomyces capoamus]